MGCINSSSAVPKSTKTSDVQDSAGGSQGAHHKVDAEEAPTPPTKNSSATSHRDEVKDHADGSRDAAADGKSKDKDSEGKEGLQSAIDPGMFITQQQAHLSDRYIRERKLGSGACGEVLLCRDRASGAERAVKVIKKSSVQMTNSENLLDEVAVVKSLDHPNIMRLYEFFEDRQYYYLVMEVYKGGELFDEIINRHKFSEADAAAIVQQVLSGVTYLHRHRIVHRDLKPENLLLETKAKDALIKIVDFGLSSHFDPAKKLKDRLGTAYYIAPEVLRKKYDEKCDIWAIGVILYILLCGYPPFGGQTDQEILRRVEKGRFSFDPPEWSKVSEEAKDLIRMMLIYDPQKRVSAETALAHKWFNTASAARTASVESPALSNALGNMKRFQASQKLAQAAVLFMGSKLTTVEETKELTEIFRSLDTNGDGQLDRKELVQGYALLMQRGKSGQEFMTEQEIEAAVDGILACSDFDQSGYIEYSEFVTVAMDMEVLMSRDRLRAAFDMFDADKSGKLAVDELRKLFVVSDEHWKTILVDVDKNNDGEVDFEEFVTMMQDFSGKKVTT